MKPTNATLNAILASRQFYTADLYQFTLATGQVLYYAGGGAQVDISYNGQTWICGEVAQGPYFDRKDNKAKVSWRLGSGNDSLTMDIIPGTAQIVGLNWLDAVRCGIFDAADFQLYRAFMTTYGVVQTGCAVLMFQGRVAEVDADRAISTFTINDYRELFTQQWPINLFAASCMNSFGDASCTVPISSFSEEGPVLSGSTAAAINATLVQASDYYDNGKIIFQSGAMAGLAFGVNTWTQGTPGVIVPAQSLPKVPATGDTFRIYPGCDKSLGGGCTRYNNTANFRGFPYIPSPETAL